MTARKVAGFALVAAPFVAWFVGSVVAAGWLIPTVVVLGMVVLGGVFALGFWLITGGAA